MTGMKLIVGREAKTWHTPWRAGSWGWYAFLLHWCLSSKCWACLFIQRIAERAADPDVQVRVPFSVRIVGAVAARLHQEVLDQPLTADGINWPTGFRWFFTLEVIGLTGIAVAFTQIGASLFGKRTKWRIEARTILISSILILMSGVLFLKMIPPRSVVTPPAPEVYDVEFMSRAFEPPTREFPIDDLQVPTDQAEIDLPADELTTGAEAESP